MILWPVGTVAAGKRVYTLFFFRLATSFSEDAFQCALLAYDVIWLSMAKEDGAGRY